jgi:outer membrane protein
MMKTSFSSRGGWWVVAQFALMGAVTVSGPTRPGPDASRTGLLAGGILIALGAAVGIAGALALGRHRTAYPTPKPGAALVQHGIYTRLRHPLYTSLMLLGFGWGLIWASATALVLTVLLCLQLRLKAAFEERHLMEVHPAYAEYARRVPRFLPGLRDGGRLPSTVVLSALCSLCLLPVSTAGIDLATAIAEAQRSNPDAMLARHRIGQAEAAVLQADAMLWPTLSLRSSYQHTDNPVGVFGAALNQQSFSPSLNFNRVPDADNLNLGGTITAPLYSGGRIAAGREAARQNQRAGEHVLAAVREQLAFEVTRTFLGIRKTASFVEATEAAVRSFEENLDIARKRLTTGKALKADVLDLEVRLAQAREEQVLARNANQLARRALANLLGRETTGTEPLPQTDIGEIPLVAPAEGIQPLRPELAALRLQQSAAESDLRAARSGHLPRASAFVSAEHNHGWRFNGNGENYTAGIVVNWDLWDGFLTRGRVNEARARTDILVEQQRRLRLAIDLEVQQARLNVTAATERVAVTAKAVDLAMESTQLTRVRFEQGLALSTQLIDAETALTGARVRRAQAEADRLIAIAALRRALGLPQLETDVRP